MSTFPSEATVKMTPYGHETLIRPSRFSALAETSFKSPLDHSYGRQSRSSNEDGSRKRRISHSPVSVNTTFELSEKNTQKLWANFEDHIKRSMQKGQKYQYQYEKKENALQNYQNQNPLKNKFDLSNKKEWEESKENKFDSNTDQSRRKVATINHPSFGMDSNLRLRPNFLSGTNALSDKFTESTKSEEKNRLFKEPLLKEIFKVSQEPMFLQYNQTNKPQQDLTKYFESNHSNQLNCSSHLIGQSHLLLSASSIQAPFDDLKYSGINNQMAIREELYSPSSSSQLKQRGDEESDQRTSSYKDPRYNEFLRNKNRIEVVDYSNLGKKQADFKNKVQQRIEDIQSEIKGDARSRLGESNAKYNNLDEYLSLQTNQYFSQNQGIGREDPHGYHQMSAQSLNQSQQFNKTTSRFNNNQQNHTQSSGADKFHFSPNTFNQTVETFDIANDIDLYPCTSKNTQFTNLENTASQSGVYSPLRNFSSQKVKPYSISRKSVQFNEELNEEEGDQDYIQSPTQAREKYSTSNKQSQSSNRLQSSKQKPKSYKSTLQSKKQQSQKASVFNDISSQKQKMYISEQPYFYKDWASQKKNDKINSAKNRSSKRQSIGSQNDISFQEDSQIIESMNQSILQSKKLNSTKQKEDEDCRRMMFNMVSNLRHQRQSKENSFSYRKPSCSPEKDSSFVSNQKSSYSIALQERFIQNQYINQKNSPMKKVIN